MFDKVQSVEQVFRRISGTPDTLHRKIKAPEPGFRPDTVNPVIRKTAPEFVAAAGPLRP